MPTRTERTILRMQLTIWSKIVWHPLATKWRRGMRIDLLPMQCAWRKTAPIPATGFTHYPVSQSTKTLRLLQIIGIRLVKSTRHSQRNMLSGVIFAFSATLACNSVRWYNRLRIQETGKLQKERRMVPESAPYDSNSSTRRLSITLRDFCIESIHDGNYLGLTRRPCLPLRGQ